MRRRYVDPDYFAALTLLAIIFVAGFTIGAVFTYFLRALI